MEMNDELHVLDALPSGKKAPVTIGQELGSASQQV
jgi:hypothetical protein